MPQLSESAKKATMDAIAALRKVQAATLVGVNLIQYGPLVIDAKAAVNQAFPQLPEGELRTALSSAMDAYADVLSLWSKSDTSLAIDRYPLREFANRYDFSALVKIPEQAEIEAKSMHKDLIRISGNDSTGLTEWKHHYMTNVDRTEALRVIWSAADDRLEHTAALMAAVT